MDYGRDVSRVVFALALWKRLTEDDLRRLRETSRRAIDRHFTTRHAKSDQHYSP
jgi:hypothetical protein